MADIDYGQAGVADGAHPASRIGGLVNWLGAALSVALIVGLCWWGYKLVIRDVTGIPVVRALEGPMRVAPENPGGERAAHQGLAVNRVAAEGEAEPPADRLVLAPAPEDLADEDKPVARVAAAEDADAPGAAIETASNDEDSGPIDDRPDGALATDLAVFEALTSAEADEVMPAVDTNMAVNAAFRPGDQVELVPAALGGIATSPRPAPRPGWASSPIQTTRAPATPVAASDPAPAAVPSGTRLVQFGAYGSEAVALAEWERLTDRFAAQMQDKSRIVERAETNGKTFYRLRAAGFADLGEARGFCSDLLAQKAACIPVVAR